MSDKVEDGGPAFPIPDERDQYGNGIREGSRGLSVRDWFAGQYLAGAAANVQITSTEANMAMWAYKFADAMLAARKGARDE